MQPNMETPPAITPPPAPPQLTYATPQEFTHPPEWTNVQVFTLDPAQRTAFLAITLGLLIIVSILSLAALLATVYFLRLFADSLETFIFITIFTPFQTFTIIRILLKRRKSWPTYRLIIADQGFIHRSLVTPRIRVDAVNIARITSTWDGFKIFLRGGGHATISKRMLNPDALQSKLEHFAPITPGKGVLGVIATLATVWGLAITNVILFYIGIVSPNRNLVLTFALLTLLITPIRVWLQFRNKNSTIASRIVVFIDLLFPILLTLKYVGMLIAGI